MEPQQSLQPTDPPDDDPDQDAPDQPPPHPSPVLLDSALSLVAQPLASAAVRVAASHPLALPLDDLNDFNVDLSWAGTDIDSLFLNDTQYIQLGDEPSLSPPPPVSGPAPSAPSSTEPASKNIEQHLPVRTTSNPDSQPEQNTALSDTPAPSDLAAHNDPPSPRRSRPPSAVQRRSRARNSPLPVKQSPIPIAPRTANKPKNSQDHKLKSAPPTPRSTQAQSSPLDTVRPHSVPLVRIPDRIASVSRETRITQSHANSVSHVPVGISPHSVIPPINMYPLQHHQFMFQPSSQVVSPADPNTQDSKIHQPSNTSNSPDTKIIKLNDTQPSPSASQRRSQQQLGTQQPFLSPTMQIMPQGVVPYDAGIVPFFQMAYAATAAGYPHGVMPAGSPNIPSTMLNPFPNRGHGVQQEDGHTVPTSATDASTINRGGQQPLRPDAKASSRPVVVQEGGTQVIIPQQKAARLERHPVLGRLQLKSNPKAQGANPSGLQNKVISETQTAPGDSQQKGFLDSTRGTASTSRAGSSSLGSRDNGQKQQKKRLVWTPELHERFVKAIGAVGLSQAVPKTLVTIMNVEGLTTEHVKSHLQKYRNSLRKEAQEEERDRSRGAAAPAGPHNPKLGTPGTNGASVIQSSAIVMPSGSAANRPGRQTSAVVTSTGRPQGLPILPSRINAFGGQLRGVIQPALETRVSATQAVKPTTAPQAALENTQRRAQGLSPRSRSVHGSQRADNFQGNVSTTGVGTGPSPNPNNTHEQNDRDAMLVEARTFSGENIKTGTQGSVSGGIIQNLQDFAAPKEPPTADPAAVGSGEKTQNVVSVGPTGEPGAPAHVSRKAVADTNTGRELSSDGVGNGTNADSNAGLTPSQVVRNPSPTSQGNRDMELELMKEDNQQMQLQVQMMLYRTISLEKKLEEVHSERLNMEISGTADASKRSAVGDATQTSVQNGDVEMKDEDEQTRTATVHTTRQDEHAGINNEMQEGAEKDKHENARVQNNKKRGYPSGNNDQSEVKALLNEQIGLHKRLKNARVRIDQQMRRDVDESPGNDKRSEGEKEDDANLLTDKERSKTLKCENEDDRNTVDGERRDIDYDVNMKECV